MMRHACNNPANAANPATPTPAPTSPWQSGVLHEIPAAVVETPAAGRGAIVAQGASMAPPKRR
eukprot:CAMPEP_0169206774 /NCGR_PEP_ID=MMETSP1016-20121227/13224_1 /TAXON_ID=342587 /ORGANISM="Karlodinium micrum, Strain CCMP2283" /LENGTH=62 /DNA_ID=CAMNT_0009283997 /DNA_START=273 /DNA_END=459 /DNA_ORIENTATION=-